MLNSKMKHKTELASPKNGTEMKIIWALKVNFFSVDSKKGNQVN